MATNLVKVLEEWMHIARTSLSNEKNKAFDKAKQEYLMTTDIKDLMKTKEDLEKQKDKIVKEIRVLWDRIFDADPYATDWEKKEAWIGWFRTMKKSSVAAEKAIMDLPATLNLEAFGSITTKFKQMMALSIWAKEQREVLAKFYWLNWTSLGIELPIDINIQDIDISDWIINVNTKQLKTWAPQK